jgi:hypothetical protein
MNRQTAVSQFFLCVLLYSYIIPSIIRLFYFLFFLKSAYARGNQHGDHAKSDS